MDRVKEFCNLVNKFGYKHSGHKIFIDFVEMAAISLRQVWERSEALEKKYLSIAADYTAEELQRIAEMLAVTTLALEENPRDFLGECFHALELHNKFAGQYFTPFEVSLMMAKLSCFDFERHIADHGYLSVSEPTCGSGAMVIAIHNMIREAGHNPVHRMWVVAQDVDRKCCCMAYIQLTLLAIPAAVIWGDTLRMECREQWITAGYHLGGWRSRIRWERAFHIATSDEKSKDATHDTAAVDNAKKEVLPNEVKTKAEPTKPQITINGEPLQMEFEF